MIITAIVVTIAVWFTIVAIIPGLVLIGNTLAFCGVGLILGLAARTREPKPPKKEPSDLATLLMFFLVSGVMFISYIGVLHLLLK